jgi:HSF-type DNA-binding
MDNGDPKQQANPPELAAASPASVVVPSLFPDKLMALLEKRVALDAVWWLRDLGDTKGVFAINRKVFTKKVLDVAFNGNKWPSITRNLNRW